MPHADSPTVEEIFEQAITRPSPDERRAYLDGACANNTKVRERVETLLQAHDSIGDFLIKPELVSNLTAHSQLSEGPGTVIDKYKILQLIGEGGFGAVYMAEQREPVKRKVALKIIKLGMDTKQVIARFEAERQALAMMDHPNIARVLDAGATETGRPYFVMDLVKGVAINEYCDTENLTTKQRLDLFIQVCNAVQHAHQKGIIHRDLKPSNVMVTLHDGKPVPKVIDFGIAKATNRELTDKTLFTEYRQFIGTPEYMSPEQAEMSGLDIDTRSDVYSLGVLLYELLTGVTPFDGKRLRSAAINEVQRIIREEEPSRPSTRLSELIHELPSPSGRGAGGEGSLDSKQSSIQYITKHRRTDPKSLSKQLRGDLDWIIMKALEKDRSRRYETANGFAMDIQRHLDNQPVLAGRPSMIYRTRKFMMRNKAVAVAGLAISGAIVAGLGISSVGLIRAQIANEKLGQSVLAEQAERQRAEDAEALAEERADRIQVALSDAESARKEAESAKSDAEVVAYNASLGAAASAIQQNDPRSVQRFLDQAPKDLRGLEWTILANTADRSIDTFGEPSATSVTTAFSPDGSLMAQQVEKSNTINIIDTRTWESVQTVPGKNRFNQGMTFSPDNRYLAVRYKGTRSVTIHDTSKRQIVVPKSGMAGAHRDALYFMAFNSDSTKCIVWGRSAFNPEYGVRIWQLDPWKDLGHLEADWGRYRPSTGAFSPDGRWLVMGADPGQPLRVFDAETFDLAHEIPISDGGETFSIAISGDSKYCATMEYPNGHIRCFSTDDWKPLWDAPNPAPGSMTMPNMLSFIPHFHKHMGHSATEPGYWLATSGRDGTVTLTAPENNQLVHSWRADASAGFGVGADQYTGRMFSAHENGVVKVQNVNQPSYFYTSAPCYPGSLTFLTGDRGLLVPHNSSSSNGCKVATRIDRHTGRAIGFERFAPVTSSHSSRMRSATESPDGNRLALVDHNGWDGGRLRIIDMNTGLALHTTRSHDWKDSTDVAWSADGRFIAVAGERGLIVFDGTTYEELARSREEPGPYVTSCAFSDDSKQLIASERNGRVVSWNTSDLKPAWIYQPIKSVALEVLSYTPDGSSIVVGAADGSIIVLDPENGSESKRFDLHGSQVTDLVFTPDGSRLLTASLDGTLRFIDPNGWRELMALPLSQTGIHALAISQDGNTIAVGIGQTITLLDRRSAIELAAERSKVVNAYEIASAMVDRFSKTEDDPAVIRQKIMSNSDLGDRVLHQVDIVLNEQVSQRFEEAYNYGTLQDIARAECAVAVLNTYLDNMNDWQSINLGWVVDWVIADPTLSTPQRQALEGYIRAFRGFALTDKPVRTWRNILPLYIAIQPNRPTSHYQLAEESVRQLVNWQQDYRFGYRTLALCLVRVGKYEEALEVAKQATRLLIESGNTTLQVQAIRVLANIGLGNSDEAQKIFSALEKEIENSRSANALTLFHEAEDALSTPNWAHQQSQERLRILAEKAQSPNVRPLDLSRYATELRITPSEQLRDLDLALELAENALELAKRTKEPGLIHRLADLYEIHTARSDTTEVNNVRDELIKLHESKIVAALDDEDNNKLISLYKSYMKQYILLKDEYGANRLVEIYCTRCADDPEFLNSLAWSILTSGQPPSNPARFALPIAEVACSSEEAAGGKSLWVYLDTLALAYSFQGTEGSDQRLDNLEKALQIQRRTLSLVPDNANKQTVNDMSSMLDSYLTTIGLALKKQERYVEAEPLLLEAFESRKRLRGETNRYTLGAMTNVGLNYNDMEKFEEARKWLQKSVELKRKFLPTKDPWIHTAEHGLQRALKGLGLNEKELTLRNIILNINPEVIESPDAEAMTLNNAAWNLMTHTCSDMHDPNRALPLAKRACAQEQASDGENLWMFLDTLALAQHMTGDTQLALDTQLRAMLLIPDSTDEATREDMEINLKKYEKATTKEEASS